MEFLADKTFGWCFVLGQIFVFFVVFMVVHRHALRRHEELTREDEAPRGAPREGSREAPGEEHHEISEP
jgi:flagellar biosynthesis/type III secretory pathway M-ring protein FliF/YscJ